MARPKRSRNDPRSNIAFYGDHLQFCQAMAWKKHQSVTAFINSVIAQKMAKYDRKEWDSPENHKEENV